MIRRAGAASATLALVAGPAAAHGGLGSTAGFLGSALHPLVAVEHLILLVGLGLVAGQMPRDRRGAGFLAVGVGLLAGIALSLTQTPWLTVAVLGMGCTMGVLVALLPGRVPAAACAALAILAGLAVGLDTDVAGMAVQAGTIPWAAISGVVAMAYIVVLDVAALVQAARWPPLLLAVRIAGSWIAAIALLLFALSLARVRAAA